MFSNVFIYNFKRYVLGIGDEYFNILYKKEYITFKKEYNK